MIRLIKYILLVVVLLSSNIKPQTSQIPAGSGTANDPYKIATLAHLNWINTSFNNMDKYYIQTADIDAGETQYWPSGFPVIGSESGGFFGHYEGDNFVIKNLYIVSLNSNVGLFGTISGGSVQNLGIENCTITSSGWFTGILAGSVGNSTISNCYASGSIHYNQTATGANYAGGLIGSSSNSFILNSYSIVNISSGGSNDFSGGFIGYADGSTIQFCYSAGSIASSASAGGFLSLNQFQQNTITACFYDTEASGISVSGGGTGRTTAQMKTKSTFTDAGWDFTDESTNGNDDVWFISSSLQSGYPVIDRMHKLPSIFLANKSINADNAEFSFSLSIGTSSVSAFGYTLSWTDGGNNMDTTFYVGASDTSGIFTHTNSSLLPSKNYTLKAFATNLKGTFYDGNNYFTTLPINPVTPSGAGTATDPFLISSLENLIWISSSTDNFSKFYKQTANINASSTQNWYDGSGWIPLGNSSTEFSGTYDGQGYTIDSLYIYRPMNTTVGFFFQVNGLVKNLGLTNASVTGKQEVGIITGWLYNGIIENCFTTGNVTGISSTVGGIAGILYYCNVSRSFNRASVTGYSYLGGIAGSGSNCSIEFSYSTGRINGLGNEKGGIIGGSFGSTAVNNSLYDRFTIGILSNGYGTGKTTTEMQTLSTFTSYGWDFAGESTNGDADYWILLADRNDGYPTLCVTIAPPDIETNAVTSISSSQATLNASVTSVGTAPIFRHGFCWSNSGIPTITDNIIDLGVKSVPGNISFNFSGLDGGVTYYIRAYAINANIVVYGDTVSFTTPITSTAPLGSGTADDPYIISSIDNLVWLTNNSSAWNKHFRQTANIRASATYYWNNGAGWQPIGSSGSYFTGTYDGNGYFIDSLFIYRPSTNVVGLFGYVIGGTIKNLGLTNVNVTGLDWTGALCGIGEPITVTNCYSKGTVSGRNSVGVLIGHVAINSTISKCYSTGSVAGNDRVGGLLGRLYYNCVLSNSYSRATVTGVNRVGGLVSGNEVATTINCYSTGAVSGSTNTGALFGFNSGTITNSFFDSETANQGANSGGGTGATTLQMKTLATFTNAGWDFTGENTNGTDDIWKIDSLYNNGYPILSTQRFFNTVFSVGIPANTSITYSNSNIHFATQGSGNITFNFTESNSTPPNLPGGSVTIGKYWEVSNISGGTVKIRLYYEPSLTTGFSGTPKIYHYNGQYWEELPTGPEVTEGSLKYVETIDYYGSFSPVIVGDDDSPLPVELTFFTAKISNGKAVLYWHTETEVQNFGFDIERKVPGKTEYEKIGFVEGFGNSNIAHDYSFTDNSLEFSGKYFYRIKQIDNDGSYTYSNEAEAQFNIPAQFSLDQNYPNPFNPITTIRFSLPEENHVKVAVFDLLGTEVSVLVNEERFAGVHTITFDASQFASGTYICAVTAGRFKAVKKMTLIK